MHLSKIKVILIVAGSVQYGNAHTAFTNFFVDGVDQGDGTAVRMSNNSAQATFPIDSVASPNMACGKSRFQTFELKSFVLALCPKRVFLMQSCVLPAVTKNK